MDTPHLGNYTFTALATDTSGNTSYLSAPITLQVPYDSDSNGLPDWWELKYFGHLGNSATSSPDGNGLTLLQDYAQGNDPTNYYSQNGTTITPTLTILSGNNQVSAIGSFTSQPLVIGLTNSSGTALINAPLTFAVISGGGLVSTAPGGGVTGLALRTDSSGQAQVYYQNPIAFNFSSLIAASAANQTAPFTESTGGGDGAFDAPTNITSSSPSPTEIDLSWVNHASSATSIVIQQSTDGGTTWTTLTTLSDPTATSYAVTGLTAGQNYCFRVAGSK